MRLRDRLAGMPPPFATRGAAAQPRVEPVSGAAGTAVDGSPGRVPADREAVVQREIALAGSRAERIAQLRGLIAGVIARDARGLAASAPELAREVANLPPRIRADQAGEPSARAVYARGELPGELRQTEHGALRVIERWLLPQHCHGRVTVSDALCADVEALAQLAFDPALRGTDLSRMLILDTETTGLSGGTGTVPFLIGLAFFDGGVLKVEQLFLDELGSEAPMLHHLRERIARASVLVSYNGKAFDWPLLRTRFLMQRMALPPLPLHLDLLHCARRLLRPRMESVRLVDVERALLGFYRQDDVDGWEIPGLYFGYLRSRDPRALVPVLRHNEHDVIALAALLERLCTRYASVQPSADPDEHLACARVALKARDLPRAQAFAHAAAEGGGDDALSRSALALCAQVAKKRGDPQSAAQAWLRALALRAGGARASEAHLALTRLFERELRDLPRAYAHARRTWPAESAHAQGRRLGRLHRRLLRMEARRKKEA